MRLKLNSINALLTENHTTIKIIFQFLNLNKTCWKIILYVNYMYFHGINRSFFIFITRQHVCDAQHVNIKNVKVFMKPIATTPLLLTYETDRNKKTTNLLLYCY